MQRCLGGGRAGRVAYGPEAIITALAVAGAGALHLVLPAMVAIVALLAILVFSYRQVIDAYRTGTSTVTADWA